MSGKKTFEKMIKKKFEIQNQINITDKEIDQMVYKLYDLSIFEIKIVEGLILFLSETFSTLGTSRSPIDKKWWD